MQDLSEITFDELLARAAKTACAGALCATGARRVVRMIAGRSVNGRRLFIVAYHLPVPAPPRAGEPLLGSLTISREVLRRQLQDLAREWEIVSLEQAWRILAAEAGTRPGRRPRPDLAAVTFDDGYVGVHEEALPVLRELHVPAVVYVPTGYVGTGHRLLHDRLYAALLALGEREDPLPPGGLRDGTHALLSRSQRGSPSETLSALIAATPHDDLTALAHELEGRLGCSESDLPASTRILDWEQLRELAAHGVDVGGHTVHHVALVNVPAARARSEIHGCHEDIARHLGAPPLHFAYPNFYHSTAVRRLVAEAGFTTAVTGPAPAGAPFDALTLPRKNLCDYSTHGVFGYSSAIARCHFDDVFATLRLRRRERFDRSEVPAGP